MVRVRIHHLDDDHRAAGNHRRIPIPVLGSFPVVRKDSSEEIIVALSGGDNDPRPTFLNLSGELPALTFSVVEYTADLGKEKASHRWIAQDGEARSEL